MIYHKDNAIPTTIFSNEQARLRSQDYTEYNFGSKSFFVQAPGQDFLDAATKCIEEEEARDIEVLLAFHRQAIGYQDCSWRIHCDTKINDMWPHRAAVLYMSDPPDFESGTMFWSHVDHGNMYLGSDEEELKRLLDSDANDLSKWKPGRMMRHKQNRLISYPCNMFHSKYPNRFPKSREVFVMFYRLGEDDERSGQMESEGAGVGNEVRDDDGRARRAA